jgi:autotransporter-associated beta strand protein
VEQFSATAEDQFGNALIAQPAFAWTTTAGTITASGLLTAPDVAAAGAVTAASGPVNGSEAFTVSVLTATWTAGGGDPNWSDASSWGGSAVAADEILQFGGTAGLDSQNDLAPGTRFNGIAFQSAAGAFVLSGNAVALGGDVVDNSLATQSVALPLVLVGDNRTLDAAAGVLRITGDISSSGGQFGIVTTGAGTVVLSGTNTYTGGTAVAAGTLEISNAAALPDGGSLTVGADAALEFGGGSGQNSSSGSLPAYSPQSSAAAASSILPAPAGSHAIGTSAVAVPASRQQPLPVIDATSQAKLFLGAIAPAAADWLFELPPSSGPLGGGRKTTSLILADSKAEKQDNQ